MWANNLDRAWCYVVCEWHSSGIRLCGLAILIRHGAMWLVSGIHAQHSAMHMGWQFRSGMVLCGWRMAFMSMKLCGWLVGFLRYGQGRSQV